MEDDFPRRYACIRAQTRRLEQGNSSVVRGNAFEIVRKTPEMAVRMDFSNNRVERALEDGTHVFHTLL